MYCSPRDTVPYNARDEGSNCVTGPGGYCSPRHRAPINSSKERSKCRGGQYFLVPTMVRQAWSCAAMDLRRRVVSFSALYSHTSTCGTCNRWVPARSDLSE